MNPGLESDLAEISRLFRQGQFEQVLSRCNDVVATAGHHPQLWHFKVRALENLKRWTDYAQAVAAGAHAHGSDPELGLRLAQLQIGGKDHAKALQTIQRLPEQVLGTPVGATLFGQALWGDGSYQLAIQHFEQAARLDPQDGRAQLALVRAQLSLNLRDSALEQLDRFLTRAPNDPNGMFMSALAKVGQVAPNQLASEFEAVLRLAPGHQLARCGLYLAKRLGADQAHLLSGFPQGELEHAQRDAIDTLAPLCDAKPFPTDVLLGALDLAPTEGLVLEFGVFHGRSLNLIAARDKRPVFGFDSFSGIPEAWGDEPAGAYSTDGRKPQVPEHVTLVDGWFEKTLPGFVAQHAQTPAAFVHIDCDIYSSTRCVLEHLDAHLVPGTVLVFDDFLGIPNARDHEYRAWNEYVASRGVSFEYLSFTAMGREVSLRITGRT